MEDWRVDKGGSLDGLKTGGSWRREGVRPQFGPQQCHPSQGAEARYSNLYHSTHT